MASDYLGSFEPLTDLAVRQLTAASEPAFGGTYAAIARDHMQPARTYAPTVGSSAQTLDVDDRRIAAAWAADCAEHVLSIYESAVPGDSRVRAAIGQARAFASGDLDVGEALRRRGGEAGAAARDTTAPAAKAAAYAAEQAAAVAHMGAHALGAAGYAGKAAALQAGCEDGGVARSAARRQVDDMSDAVACALSSLPLLGEDPSGPIGPGRLCLGHVGETIREIQRLLIERRSVSCGGPEVPALDRA